MAWCKQVKYERLMTSPDWQGGDNHAEECKNNELGVSKRTGEKKLSIGQDGLQ